MIVIWSWDCCPTCQHAKFFLEESNVPYIEKRLGVDYTIRELKEATGKKELPQFFIDDKYIGGYEYVFNNIEKIKEMI
jgi:glutaredoxin